MTASTSLAADLLLALDPARVLTAAGIEPDPMAAGGPRDRPARALLCAVAKPESARPRRPPAYTRRCSCRGRSRLPWRPHNDSRQSCSARPAHCSAGSPGGWKSRANRRPRSSWRTVLESSPSRQGSDDPRVLRGRVARDRRGGPRSGRAVRRGPADARCSGGRLLALSTPYGQRGWFFEAWIGPEPWIASSHGRAVPEDLRRVPRRRTAHDQADRLRERIRVPFHRRRRHRFSYEEVGGARSINRSTLEGGGDDSGLHQSQSTKDSHKPDRNRRPRTPTGPRTHVRRQPFQRFPLGTHYPDIVDRIVPASTRLPCADAPGSPSTRPVSAARSSICSATS